MNQCEVFGKNKKEIKKNKGHFRWLINRGKIVTKYICGHTWYIKNTRSYPRFSPDTVIISPPPALPETGVILATRGVLDGL